MGQIRIAKSIQQLRALRDGTTLPDLYGFVGTYPLRWDPTGWEQVQPMPGLTVTARSDSAEFRTQTADDGSYGFRTLPQGRYQLSVAAPRWAAGLVGMERGTPQCEPGRSLCDEFRSFLGRAYHRNGSWPRRPTRIRNDYRPVRRSGNTARWTIWRSGERWPLRDP